MAARAASDPACIFCRIVAGEIPCYRVHEDERVLAFLDVGPLARGHTLIIPREHYARLDQMPPEVAMGCMSAVPRLARAVCEAAGAPDWNFLQNNGEAAQQSVDHVHFHIIPRRPGDGLGYRWNAGKLDAEEGRRLASEIASRLAGGAER